MAFPENSSPSTASAPLRDVEPPIQPNPRVEDLDCFQRPPTVADDELLTVGEVVTLTRLAPHNLDSLRTRGYGPPWLLTSVGLRYRRSDVEAWLERVRERERRRTNGTPGSTAGGEDLDDEEERTAWFKLPLDLRLMEWRRRLERLHARIREQCPGPEHAYVDHKDHRPPWCDSCGWSDTGLHKSETGFSHMGRRRDVEED